MIIREKENNDQFKNLNTFENNEEITNLINKLDEEVKNEGNPNKTEFINQTITESKEIIHEAVQPYNLINDNKSSKDDLYYYHTGTTFHHDKESYNEKK